MGKWTYNCKVDFAHCSDDDSRSIDCELPCQPCKEAAQGRGTSVCCDVGCFAWILYERWCLLYFPKTCEMLLLIFCQDRCVEAAARRVVFSWGNWMAMSAICLACNDPRTMPGRKSFSIAVWFQGTLKASHTCVVSKEALPALFTCVGEFPHYFHHPGQKIMIFWEQATGFLRQMCLVEGGDLEFEETSRNVEERRASRKRVRGDVEERRGDVEERRGTSSFEEPSSRRRRGTSRNVELRGGEFEETSRNVEERRGNSGMTKAEKNPPKQKKNFISQQRAKRNIEYLGF